MRVLIYLFAIVFCGLSVFASNQANFKKLDTFNEGDAFVAELSFDKTIAGDKVALEYINQTIQVDIPGGVLSSGKKTIPLKGKDVKSIYLYQVADDTLRVRFILSGIDAKKLKDAVEVVGEGTTLRISLKKADKLPVKENAVVKTEVLTLTPRELGESKKDESKEEIKDDVLVKAAAQEVAVLPATDIKKVDAVVPEAKIESPRKITENEIPVLADNKALKKAESNPLFRMIFGIAVMGIMGVGVYYGSRKWAKKKDTKRTATKIDIVTQHYLGPKKSLAIVRVAGENILIGITDHNISMLKTLALMEEELSELEPTSFSGTLSKSIKNSDENSRSRINYVAPDFIDTDELDDEFSIKGIKDIVSNRLKNMRNI